MFFFKSNQFHTLFLVWEHPGLDENARRSISKRNTVCQTGCEQQKSPSRPIFPSMQSHAGSLACFHDMLKKKNLLWFLFCWKQTCDRLIRYIAKSVFFPTANVAFIYFIHNFVKAAGLLYTELYISLSKNVKKPHFRNVNFSKITILNLISIRD